MLPVLQNIGSTEIIVVAIVLVILFGGKKLPEFGRGIGEAVKTLKQGIKGLSHENDK